MNGIGAFHVHRGHAFAGFQIEDGLVVARCGCGEVLDWAEAEYARCPECGGAGEACVRCDGTGLVVDHAALSWRLPV